MKKKDENNIGCTGAMMLSESLKTNSTLQILDLCLKGTEIFSSFSLFFNNQTKIFFLNSFQDDNNIGSDGAKYLADCLKKNPKLQELFLDMNNIEARGTFHISEGLKNNRTLLKLDLSSNNLNCEGAIYIADCLRKNKTLLELNLSLFILFLSFL